MADRARDSAVETRIIAAAVRLFAAQGFDATSVQEIVAEAAVTKGALYHYFASKNELLYEIYHSLLSRQLADLDRIIGDGQPPDETIRSLIAELVETTTGSIDEVKVYVREMHRLDRAHLHAIRAQRRRYHMTFRDFIEGAQRTGVFTQVASADTVTFILLGMVNEIPTWYRAGGRKTPAQIAEEVASFVLAALAPMSVAAP